MTTSHNISQIPKVGDLLGSVTLIYDYLAFYTKTIKRFETFRITGEVVQTIEMFLNVRTMLYHVFDMISSLYVLLPMYVFHMQKTLVVI